MHKTNPHPLLAILVLLLLAACASIGSPRGGAYDITPPKVVRCQPANMATDNKDKRLTLTFDEYVVIENASEKVVVSPPQKEMPEIRTSGKRIHITLYDTLQENTTYTIDFADAIVDNNEGNPMGNFTYSFSTGDHIDTMEVSGTLLEAENLEPVKGMLVGLYADLSDTAFTTRPFARVARTDGRGRFTIKGVAPGRYRIYGLQDMDGDSRFSQKAEKIAFDTIVIEPSCGPDSRQDTVWTDLDSTAIDTIKTVHFTHFYPDNVVLRAFTEGFQELHLLKTERPVPDFFTLYFTAPMDSLPIIKGLNFDIEDCGLVLERSAQGDTLTYWITDTLVSDKDTLSLSMTYQDTDTLGKLAWRTDTLDRLAKCLGHKNYSDFVKDLKTNTRYNSSFFAAEQLSSGDIADGCTIEIGWSPNRLVTLRYLGNSLYEVTRSQNSKMQEGDRFVTGCFIKGQPLYLPYIERTGGRTAPFVAGRNGGLTIIKVK